jgi:hypothetical protein
MTVGVVAHDAGGAEVISSYIRQRGLNCIFCLEGPARTVFARKLGVVDSVALEELVARSDRILCGTSFLADLEWRALGAAAAAGTHATTVLEHWVNYRQRFLRQGTYHYPDELWVGDVMAERLAREEFPAIPVTLVPNAYFLDIQQELASLGPAAPVAHSGARVLYVTEPLRDDALALYGDEMYWGYTEEQAVRYFLTNVRALAPDLARIVIRAHPQEHRQKYEWAIEEFALPIVCERESTLLQQIVDSDTVAGGATMAMVVALLAGKRVVSCIPPGGWGKIPPLPHPEIERLEDLLARVGDPEAAGETR